MGGIGGMPGRGDTYRLATHESPRPSPTLQSQNQAASQGMGTDQVPGQHASRRNLQVDFSSGGSVGRSGRSPSVSPDRGSAPSSPYSVPQIAPMPSSKLCPICNTTELTSADRAPNFNKCTQCHTTVCNQCGFNPNPHLTEVNIIIPQLTVEDRDLKLSRPCLHLVVLCDLYLNCLLIVDLIC